jgi:hypothetical protein
MDPSWPSTRIRSSVLARIVAACVDGEKAAIGENESKFRPWGRKSKQLRNFLMDWADRTRDGLVEVGTI